MHRLLTIWFLDYKCCRASHSEVSPAPVRHFLETFPMVSAWLRGFRVPSSLLPHGFQAIKFFISTKSSFVSPGISQVVRSFIRETLVAISWLWLLTKLHSDQLKPHSHLLLMILVFLAMILILSVLVLNSNNSRNFGWWPFRIALYILAVLWYNWPSIGGALTRWGTREDQAIFGSPHNLWISLRLVEQKLLMWEASIARVWDPYM